MDKKTLTIEASQPKATLNLGKQPEPAPAMTSEESHMTALAFLLQQIEVKQAANHKRAKEMMALNHEYTQAQGQG